jgi:hypothetical protein
MNNYKLWYTTPAVDWNSALPIGNGIQGAMIFGGIESDEIQLNHESFWSGYPADNDNPDCLAHLDEMRQLIFDKKYNEAQKLCEKYLIAKNEYKESYGSHQTAGSLFIEGNYKNTDNYKRELNIYDGVAKTSFGNCERTYFSSYKYDVTVVKINNSDFTLNYVRENADILTDGDTITVTGKLPLEYAVIIKTVKQNNDTIIYITAATAYKTDVPPMDACQARIKKALEAGYDEIYSESVNYFNTLLDRVKLDLNSPSELNDIPTDQRLLNPKDDFGLVEMYFMFGRYLLIGSSEGQLPANLQGIWNKDYHAPWEADYHININAQMNYWHANMCDLGEFNRTFFDYIEFLSVEGKSSAKVNYGCNGWVAHTITNPWGFTSLGNHPSWGSFMCAGAWCCRHIWDHYLYTEDIEFLRRYYGVIKSAADFFLDFLVTDPNTGYLVTVPSNSPENSFIDPVTGKAAAICAGPTMDNAILYELFNVTIDCCELFGDDASYIEKIRLTRDKLPPIKLGKHGQIMEWLEDFDENEPGHRHVSPLYGLHPANLITKSKTPDLFDGARKTIERRLSHGGGHTGWSRAWIINFYARLQDGNAAYANIEALLEKSTLPNMFDNHPPFQIDGNFGAAAGIGEMLVQSHEDFIHLLPALPDAWRNGEVKGLIARGGYKIDIKWVDNKVVSYKIKSKKTKSVKIFLNNELIVTESEVIM